MAPLNTENNPSENNNNNDDDRHKLSRNKKTTNRYKNNKCSGFQGYASANDATFKKTIAYNRNRSTQLIELMKFPPLYIAKEK